MKIQVFIALDWGLYCGKVVGFLFVLVVGFYVSWDRFWGFLYPKKPSKQETYLLTHSQNKKVTSKLHKVSWFWLINRCCVGQQLPVFHIQPVLNYFLITLKAGIIYMHCEQGKQTNLSSVQKNKVI